MQHLPHKFTTSDIDNILFGNKVPEVTIYPFFKSCNEYLKQTGFVIRLDSREFDKTNCSLYKKLSKIIVSIKGSAISENELLMFLGNMAVIPVSIIYGKAKKEFEIWQDYYYKHLHEYAIGQGSKYQWEIAQSIGIFAVMSYPFTFEQSAWIAYASSVYRADEHKFTVDIVESLKPWFNREMYFQIQKSKESKRDNVVYEKQKLQMLQGSFGLPEGDKDIISKLEQEKMMEANADDLDVIR